MAAQNFSMEHGYVLVPVDAENNIVTIHCAGTEIIPPGKIGILGEYPWLYGMVEDHEEKYFTINMKSGEMLRFTEKQKEDFLSFLEKNELPFHHLFYYTDLFPADKDPEKIQARKQLKNKLSKSVNSKKSGLF